MADKFEEVNKNKGQVLSENQLRRIAKDLFALIDVRGCEALSYGECLEFIMFAKEQIYMHNTNIDTDRNGNCKTDFNSEEFEKLYQSFKKVYVRVEASDKLKIINKLGEDVFDGKS